MTEFFGPVLGVMKARNLQEAIALVNQTGYGLTSGLESLDDREQELWLEEVQAGNLYVNRVTTGAIVLRQPFGGMGKSAFGPGIKAGGPNYVAQLMDFEECSDPDGSRSVMDPQLADLRGRLQGLVELPDGVSREEVSQVVAAIGSYDLNVRKEFGETHDHVPTGGAGQSPPLPAGPRDAHSPASGRQLLRALRQGGRRQGRGLSHHRQRTARCPGRGPRAARAS